LFLKKYLVRVTHQNAVITYKYKDDDAKAHRAARAMLEFYSQEPIVFRDQEQKIGWPIRDEASGKFLEQDADTLETLYQEANTTA
jgi:hypothetical protein